MARVDGYYLAKDREDSVLKLESYSGKGYYCSFETSPAGIVDSEMYGWPWTYTDENSLSRLILDLKMYIW